jgi:CRP-like cAMP-binding protein
VRQYNFPDGQLILEEGDPSDCVYRILFGEVEVFTEGDGEKIVLGAVQAGEFLGEMGIIERRPRSASARAKGPVTAEKLERWEFVQLISEEPVAAHRLIDRLSERLRLVNNRLAQLATAGVSTAEMGSHEAAAQAVSAAARVKILAASESVVSFLPKAGLVITKFPFVVGRQPDSNALQADINIDLAVPDILPYKMSCPHLALFRSPEGYAIRDLGSRLGTQVNGHFLGEHFDLDVQPLQEGENTIIAGGIGSPFCFTIVIDGV